MLNIVNHLGDASTGHHQEQLRFQSRVSYSPYIHAKAYIIDYFILFNGIIGRSMILI